MDRVSFKFYHDLSKVKFTFINGWRNAVTLQITNIKLSNVKNTGSLTTSGTMAQGSDKMQSSAWSGQTGTADYENKSDDVMNTSIYGESYEFENFLLPTGLSDSQMKLTFTVQVTNSQGTSPDLGTGAGNPVVKEVVIPKDVVTEWKPGYAYNFENGRNLTYTVSVADAQIAEASVSGTMLTVGGVAAGSTKITVKPSAGQEQTMIVTVRKNAGDSGWM